MRYGMAGLHEMTFIHQACVLSFAQVMLMPEVSVSCYRMRFSLLVLGDEDTLWEIFQECVSRCDCQLNSHQPAALALLHQNFCCIRGKLLHAAQCDSQQMVVSYLAHCSNTSPWSPKLPRFCLCQLIYISMLMACMFAL